MAARCTIVHSLMGFKWDAQPNARKHGIQFMRQMVKSAGSRSESMHLDAFWLWSIRGGRVE